MAEPSDFKYGKIYEFHTRKSDEAKKGVYVGNNLRGRGILIHKFAWDS